MALVKYREWPIDQDNLDKQTQVAIPLSWLRDHLIAGETLGLYMDSDNPGRLVITKVPPSNKVGDVAELPAGESSVEKS